MASRLESLPAEMLIRVIDYIPRPTDLKALCLTSKTVRVPATAALYYEVNLDSDPGSSRAWDQPDEKIAKGLLSATNPGLSQIRKITCYRSARENVRATVEAIPKDILREFNCPNTELDGEIATILFMRQRKLEKIAFGPVSFNLHAFVRAGVLGQPPCANVKALGTPRSTSKAQDLKGLQQIISNAPLDRLCVKGCTIDTEIDTDSMEDSRTMDELLLQTLFLRKSSHDPMLGLRSLAFSDIYLTHAERILFPGINFSGLQSLELLQAMDAVGFISALTRHFNANGSRLQRFKYSLFDEKHLTQTIMSDFLNSFRGLRSLFLDGLDKADLPEASALENHAPTLEIFACKLWNGYEIPLEPELLEVISQKCRKLRQVAVDLPFETRARYLLIEPELRALLSLPDLRCLRMCSLPLDSLESREASEDITGLEVDKDVYAHQVDAIVSSQIARTFEEMDKKRTSPVICFGQAEPSWTTEHSTSVTAACYVPIQQIDIFGRTTTVLQKVQATEVKYFEPECDVLYWPRQNW